MQKNPEIKLHQRTFRFIYMLLWLIIPIPFLWFEIQVAIGIITGVILSELLSFIGDYRVKVSGLSHAMLGSIIILIYAIISQLDITFEYEILIITFGTTIILHDLLYHVIVALFPSVDCEFHRTCPSASMHRK